MPSQQTLDSFWAYYVKLNAADVAYYYYSTSVGYDANFKTLLDYIVNNKLYGFQNPGIRSLGNTEISSGPTKS
jgi:hypothetical protein